MPEGTVAWFAGVDWGSEKHQACLLDAQGSIVGEQEFTHSGKGLAELAHWIQSTVGVASSVVIAIEVSHGPVVDVLIDRGFAVHAINPKQLDRLRDRFSLAGAKDDRRDAYVLADGLRTDKHLFRLLQIVDPRLMELRAWSRLAEELQQERVRLRATESTSSYGGIIPRCWSSPMSSPPRGFSSFGSSHLRQPRPPRYAGRPSVGYLSSIEFAA